jgi:hypothetical protein
MIKQPLYVKYNTSRKRKFQLLTQVRREGEIVYLYKCAEDIEAQEFLNHIYQMYEILNKSKLPFKVNRILEKKDTYLRFEFVQGSLWLSDLEDIASRDSLKTFISELEKFQNLLEKFPSENNTLNSDFIDIFGDFPKEQKYSLLYPGVLDLNFDNILKDKKGNLHLIDYEWTFNFAIPKRYVLYRSIFNIFVELRYLQNKNTTLKRIENHFQFTVDEIKTYLKWEENFQRYVLKEDPLGIDFMSTRELLLSNKEFSKDPIWKKEERETLEEELKASQEELKASQEELKASQEELKASQEDNRIKGEELHNIYNSKSWKLTQPARVITKRIKNLSK